MNNFLGICSWHVLLCITHFFPLMFNLILTHVVPLFISRFDYHSISACYVFLCIIAPLPYLLSYHHSHLPFHPSISFKPTTLHAYFSLYSLSLFTSSTLQPPSFSSYLSLPITVMFPSPNLVWKSGASVMTSHLYVPEVPSSTSRSTTVASLLLSTCATKGDEVLGRYKFVGALVEGREDGTNRSHRN